MTPPGEPHSFSRIADELSVPLLRYFSRYAGERAVAEDLLQETLIRVAKGLPAFAGRANVKTWVFSIATRVAADYFRQPANRVDIVEADELADRPDDGPPVDQRLAIDEMNACVRQVIDSLPEDYRAALVLHDLEGMSVPQTAEICGWSLPTAKIRIHRARLRLRQALQGECVFYRDSDNVFRCDHKP